MAQSNIVVAGSIEEKICIKCNELKPLPTFRKRKQRNKIVIINTCGDCEKLEKKKYDDNIKNDPVKKEETKQKRKQWDKTRYERKKKEIRQKQNKYYAENKTNIQAQRKKFKEENPERVKKWKKTDTLARKLGSNLRRRVRKEIGSGKGWLEYLDCTFEHLKSWFEFNFKLGGNIFTWDNYGQVWTIDHVKPCNSFDLTNQNDIETCFSWRNTLPVTKKYNMQKNGKIVYGDIIKLNERVIVFEKEIRLKMKLPTVCK